MNNNISHYAVSMAPNNDPKQPITPALCRAARGYLGWTQEQLAGRAGVSVVTIRNFEKGITTPHRATMAQIQVVLETAGVELLPDTGTGAGLRFPNQA